LHERYGDQGLKILAVNAWDESPAMIRKLIQDKDLDYTILLYGSEVFEGPYKGKSIPHGYLIDHKGEIRYVHHGWGEGDEKLLAAKIESLLAEKSGG